MRTRSKEASIKIADRVCESFRRSYGYRTTASGRKVARDEPGESDNNPDVRRHNQYVAQQLKQRKNKEAARKRMIDRGIVPKKQGKPMYEVKENSPTPNLQALEGNTYYFKCPNDNRYFKTIYIKRNPFSPNHLQPMISNEIFGEPPASMQPISPLYVHSLLRMSSSPF